MEPKHGGCGVCKSKEEPVLSSGVALKGGMSASLAVCSRPECRAAVEFVR